MYCRVINKLYILPTVLLRANSQITHILVMCSHASINLPITPGLEVAREATTLANWFSFLTASEARHFSLPMRLERTVSTGCDRCMMTAFCLGAKLAKGELWGLEIRCRNSSQVDDGICSLEHFKNLPKLTQIRKPLATPASKAAPKAGPSLTFVITSSTPSTSVMICRQSGLFAPPPVARICSTCNPCSRRMAKQSLRLKATPWR